MREQHVELGKSKLWAAKYRCTHIAVGLQKNGETKP